MSGRYILLVPALFIDGLQAMLSLGLAGVFTAAGGAVSWIPGAAVAVVPVGILLGFVINFAITMTFGSGLIAALALCDMFYLRYLVAGGGEMIPGLNNLPFWTLFVLLCILQKNAEEGKAIPAVAMVAISGKVFSVRDIMSKKEKLMDAPRVRQTLSAVGLEQERVPQPKTGEDLVNLARSRQTFQDIRTTKPHARPV